MSSSDDQMAARMFPSMGNGQPAGGRTPLTGDDFLEQTLTQPEDGGKASPEISTLTDEQISARMYGDDAGAGDPLADAASYDHITGDLLDSYEIEARGERDAAEIDTLARTRRGLNEAFHRYSVGASEAKEVMGLATEFFRNPKDAESAEVERANTEAALQKKWGARYQTNVNAAKRVVADLNRRIPNFADKLDRSGLGNSQKLIETLARAGNRRR